MRALVPSCVPIAGDLRATVAPASPTLATAAAALTAAPSKLAAEPATERSAVSPAEPSTEPASRLPANAAAIPSAVSPAEPAEPAAEPAAAEPAAKPATEPAPAACSAAEPAGNSVRERNLGRALLGHRECRMPCKRPFHVRVLPADLSGAFPEPGAVRLPTAERAAEPAAEP